MIEAFDIDKAKKVEYDWNTVEDCIKKLIEYREKGENVYIEIGRFVLYSSNANLGMVNTLKYFLYQGGFLKDDDDLER